MGKHVAAQQVLARPSGRTHQRFRRPLSRGRSVLSVFAFAAVGAVCVVNVVDPTAGAIASPYFQPAGRFDGESAQTVTATDGYDTAFERDGYAVVLAPKPVITAPPVDAAGAPGAGGPVIAPDPGSAKALAREMLAARGMGDDQYSCLVSLWNKESGWRVTAANPSGAYGIPQALPGRKMATVGADWQTNPVTQITWGLGYIAARYGSPCGAWAHSQAKNFY